MKVAIVTYGCKLNQYETQLMTEQLINSGFQVVNHQEQNAQVYIINSCAVTSKASKEARMLAKKLSKKGKVIYTGCDAYLEEGLESFVTLVGNSYKNRIAEVLKEQKKDISDKTKYYPLQNIITDFYEKSRAFVKIQEGCDNHCTYCIIPFLRDKERDKRENLVLKEIQILLERGFSEIVLTGTNIGSYNNLKSLLKKISLLKGNFRVRLSSIEPMYVDYELIDMVADLNIAKHLHIPLQSGCDRILRLMGRNYKTKDFAKIVEYCHKKGIFVGTDVIVGFYGEDDEAFKETYRFIEALPFSFGHVFSYSVRPYTAAAKIKEKLPKGPVVRERNRQLRELFDTKKKDSIQSLLNKNLEVVVETTTVNIKNKVFFKAIASQYVKLLVDEYKRGLRSCKLVSFDGEYGYAKWLE